MRWAEALETKRRLGEDAVMVYDVKASLGDGSWFRSFKGITELKEFDPTFGIKGKNQTKLVPELKVSSDQLAANEQIICVMRKKRQLHGLRIFYIQEGMEEHAEAEGHEFFITFNILRETKSGKKYDNNVSIAGNNNSYRIVHAFASFPSPEHWLEYEKQLLPEYRVCFERIMASRVRPYFDLDSKTVERRAQFPDLDDVSLQELEDRIIDSIAKGIIDVGREWGWPAMTWEDNFRVAAPPENYRQYKLSIHIVIVGVGSLQDSEEAWRFAAAVKERVAKEDAFAASTVDLLPYANFQNFRFIGHAKVDSLGRFMEKRHDYPSRDFLISPVESEAPLEVPADAPNKDETGSKRKSDGSGKLARSEKRSRTSTTLQLAVQEWLSTSSGLEVYKDAVVGEIKIWEIVAHVKLVTSEHCHLIDRSHNQNHAYLRIYRNSGKVFQGCFDKDSSACVKKKNRYDLEVTAPDSLLAALWPTPAPVERASGSGAGEPRGRRTPSEPEPERPSQHRRLSEEVGGADGGGGGAMEGGERGRPPPSDEDEDSDEDSEGGGGEDDDDGGGEGGGGDAEIELADDNCTIIDSDADAARKFLEQHGDRVKKSGAPEPRIFVFTERHLWTCIPKVVEMTIMKLCMDANFVKETARGGLVPYSANIAGARNICSAICVNVSETPEFCDKLYHGSIGKIFFKNGYWEAGDFHASIAPGDSFTTIRIPWDFPERKEAKMAEVSAKLLDSILPNKDQQKNYLQHMARGMAGLYKDKSWCVCMGERNCGKGTLQAIAENAFKGYVGTLCSDSFLLERVRRDGDEAKKNSALLGYEYARLLFTNEITCDKASGLKMNGAYIKGKLASGGDTLLGRKNYQDEVEFRMQGRLFMNVNDLPEVSPTDALETASIFVFPNVFKPAVSDADPAFWKVADPNIKHYCADLEVCAAYTHLVLDQYQATPVVDCAEVAIEVSKFREEAADEWAALEAEFLIGPGNGAVEADQTATEEVEGWAKLKNYNISTQKLRQRVERLGGKRGKIKITVGGKAMERRGYKFMKRREDADDV